MNAIILTKEPKKGRCQNVECGKKCKGKLCSTCRCRKSRLADPIRYAYNNLKNRAKERGVYFDLTIEQFRKFCYKTEYHLKKGRGVGSYDIDRIKEGKTPGYTISNIRIHEKVKNIKKYWRWWSKKSEREIELPDIPKEDLPF